VWVCACVCVCLPVCLPASDGTDLAFASADLLIIRLLTAIEIERVNGRGNGAQPQYQRRSIRRSPSQLPI